MKIVIEIEGGVLQSVATDIEYFDTPLEVYLIDQDEKVAVEYGHGLADVHSIFEAAKQEFADDLERGTSTAISWESLPLSEQMRLRDKYATPAEIEDLRKELGDE